MRTLFITLANFIAIFTYAQTVKGSIAFITVNSDQPKGFEFVVINEISSGTELVFTDDAWIENSGSFRGGEGTLSYIAENDLIPGSVISYNEDQPNGFSKKGSFNLSSSGDNIIAFTISNTDTCFIAGIGWAKNKSGNWEFNEKAATSTSDIPPTLSIEDGSAFYLSNKDNYQLNDSVHVTIENMRSTLYSVSSYLENDTLPFTSFKTKLLFDSELKLPVYEFCEGDDIILPENANGHEIFSDSLFSNSDFSWISDAGLYSYFVKISGNTFQRGKLTVHPQPKITIEQTGNQIKTEPEVDCQWYINGIFECKNKAINCPESGTVYAKYTSDDGCSAFSQNLQIKSSNQATSINESLYGDSTIRLIDIKGATVYRGKYKDLNKSDFKNKLLFISTADGYCKTINF